MRIKGRKSGTDELLTLLVFLFFLFVPCAESWGQCTPSGVPLVLDYTSSSMGVGTSQNLSASGGSAPYEWSVLGGGTHTSDGANATYYAASSNPDCANNAMVMVQDCRKNIAYVKIAANGYTADSVLQWAERIKCYCFEINYPSCAGGQYNSSAYYHWKRWNCSGELNYEAWWINGIVYYSRPEWDVCGEPPSHCTNYCACHAEDMNNCGCWGGPGYCEYCSWGGYANVLCDQMNDKRDANQKAQGCCPINPDTLLPVDGNFPNESGTGAPRMPQL